MKNNPAKIKGYFERDLFFEMNKYLNKREIIAIIGPRQSGKTTLLEMIYKNLPKNKRKLFLTFEKRTNLEIFNRDIENFKKLYVDPYDYIFIDEYQYADNAGKNLKYLFDTTKTKIIISGSSSLEIKQMGKYLVGRIFTFNLYPLNFSEFLKVKDRELYEIIFPTCQLIEKLLKSRIIPSKIKNPLKSDFLRQRLKDLFYQYLIYGGFPRVVKAKSQEEKKLVLESIVENYLLKEIRTLLKLATENELLILGKFLALQIGNLISYSELSAVSNLNFLNLKKHLKILEETFVIRQIRPFFKNKRVELVKNPKPYFLDHGFRNKLINNFSSLENRPDLGALVENFVFNALQQKKFITQINFWRTKSQAEVDFICEIEGEIIPIEAKFSPLGKMVVGKSLFSFIKNYQPKKGFVTTNDEFGIRKINTTSVFFIPVYYCL